MDLTKDEYIVKRLESGARQYPGCVNILLKTLTLLDFLSLYLLTLSLCVVCISVCMCGGPWLTSRLFLDDYSTLSIEAWVFTWTQSSYSWSSYQAFSGIPSLPLVLWTYTRLLHLPGIYLGAGAVYWLLCLHIKHLSHSAIFLTLWMLGWSIYTHYAFKI